MGILRRMLGFPSPEESVEGSPLSPSALATYIVASAHDLAFVGRRCGSNILRKATRVPIDERKLTYRIEFLAFYIGIFVSQLAKHVSATSVTIALDASAAKASELLQSQMGTQGRSLPWHDVETAIAERAAHYAELVRTFNSPDDLLRLSSIAYENIASSQTKDPFGAAALEAC